MENERAMELLNAVIDHISCGENITTTLEELDKIGFTREELVEDFGFSPQDMR